MPKEKKQLPSGTVILMFTLFTVALSFLGVVQSGYVWDDSILFLENSSLRGGAPLIAAISNPILPGSGYFRPFVLFTFILEFNLFGLNPAVSHCVNLLIHLLNVALVFSIVLILLRKQYAKLNLYIAAMVSGLLYGLHPAIIEPVAWVSGRFDLLVTFWSLLGVLAGLSLSGYVRSFAVGLCFFLAACSKEMAVTFPVLMFGMLVLKHSSRVPLSGNLRGLLKKYWLDFFLIIVFGIFYLSLRHIHVPGVYRANLAIQNTFQGVENVYLVLNTLFFYVKTAVFPFSGVGPLHPLYANLFVSHIVLGALLVLSLVASSVYILMRSASPALVLFLLFCVALLPVIRVFPLVIAGNIGHERFLVLPLAFLSIGATFWGISIQAVVQKQFPDFMSRLSIYGACGMVVWVAACILTIRSIVPLWESNLSLWAWAYRENPDIPFAQASFITSASKSGDFFLVEDLVGELEEKARDNVVWDVNVIMSLAFYYTRIGEFEKARNQLDIAISWQEPPHKKYLDKFDDLLSIAFDGASYDYAVYYRGLYHTLAEIELAEGNYSEAQQAATISLFYQKDFGPSWLMRSLSSTALGNVQEAKRSLLLAINYLPNGSTEDVHEMYEQFLAQFCQGEQNEIAPACLDSRYLSGLERG